MILLIIFIALLVIGIVCLCLYNKIICNSFTESLIYPGAVSLIVGGLGLIVVVIANLIQNTPIAIANTRTEYQMTVSSLNNTYQAYMDRAANYEAISVVQYNEQVREFKTDIITHQRALNNPWINIFISSAYKDFDANAVQYIGNYIG